MNAGGTLTRWRGYLADCLSLFPGYRRFADVWDFSHSALAAGETRWAPALQSARWGAPRVVIVVTPGHVNEIAEAISDLSSNFDPVAWLEETWADISIVATEAVKDVVWEALAIGLADHPLVLSHQAEARARNP